MTNFIRIGIGILTAGLLSGCLFLDGSFHDDGFREFGFDETENPHLQRDWRGDVDRKEGTIEVEVPSFADRSTLIPDFETGALRVTCDGKEVEAASTVLDFRTPKTFRVEAADGSFRDWVIEVSLREARLYSIEFTSTSPEKGTFVQRNLPRVSSSFTVLIPQSWASDGIQVYLPLWWEDSPPLVRLDKEERTNEYSAYSGYSSGFRFGSVSSSTQVPHTLSFPKGDGTEITHTFAFELAPLTFEGFQVLKADNPGLESDLGITINAAQKSIGIQLPFSADATALKPKFTHTGLKVRNGTGEVLSGSTPLDLSVSSTLTIEGAEGSSETWALEVARDPASTAKALTSIRFFRSSGEAVQTKPAWASLIEGTDLDPTAAGIDWDPRYSTKFSNRAIYVEVVSEGVAVTAGGAPLAQGLLYGNPSVYDPANWIDFTTPVNLTIHAEDGSTQVLTITMEAS